MEPIAFCRQIKNDEFKNLTIWHNWVKKMSLEGDLGEKLYVCINKTGSASNYLWTTIQFRNSLRYIFWILKIRLWQSRKRFLIEIKKNQISVITTEYVNFDNKLIYKFSLIFFHLNFLQYLLLFPKFGVFSETLKFD